VTQKRPLVSLFPRPDQKRHLWTRQASMAGLYGHFQNKHSLKERYMRRRQFIAGFGAITLLPFTLLAQQAMPVIGVLSSASSRDYAARLANFRKALSETGYVDGQNGRIEYLFADEQYDRLPALASSLVSRQVNVLIAASAPAAL